MSQGRRLVNPRVKWLFGGLGTTVVGVILVFALDRAFSGDNNAQAKTEAPAVKKEWAKKSEAAQPTEPPKIEPERGPIDERQLVKIYRQYRETVPVLKPDFEKLIVGRDVHLQGRVRWVQFNEGEEKGWFVLDLDGSDLDVKCSVGASISSQLTEKKVVVVVGELTAISDDEAVVNVASLE